MSYVILNDLYHYFSFIYRIFDENEAFFKAKAFEFERNMQAARQNLIEWNHAVNKSQSAKTENQVILCVLHG